MIYVAIPTVTPRLAACALEAIERTTPEPHRVIVARGGSHGENLDRAFAALPEDAEWFFTCDDDAAPLRVGWLSWLMHQGEYRFASFWENARGFPHVLGTLWHVGWLRRVDAKFSHGTRCVYDVGEGIFHGLPPTEWPGFFAPKCGARPWWLRTCDVAADDTGRLIFAHLGGGTIGHTWLHKGRLYPRIPTWLWPIMVRRHLDSVGAPRPRDRGRDAGGRVPLVVDRAARAADGARFLDSQHPHGAGKSLDAGSVAQMERARQLQAWEER